MARWPPGHADGQVRIGIVRLANLGQRVLNEIGVKPIPSEWGRLEARDGAEQVKRIAWACALADHARQRGYVVEVCPTAGQPARADVLLTRADERSLCHCLRGRPAAGLGEADGQGWGAGAVCAHAAGPQRPGRGGQGGGRGHGRATDLELLLSGEDHGALWAESW